MQFTNYLLLVGTGILELLGWRALGLLFIVRHRVPFNNHISHAQHTRQNNTGLSVRYIRLLVRAGPPYFSMAGWPGVPDTEVFLELGRELLLILAENINC